MLFGDYAPTRTDAEKGDVSVTQQEQTETVPDESVKAVQ